MKVKVFDGSLREHLERAMQEWLNQNPNVEVRFMSQSEDTGCVTVTVLYTERSEEVFD